MHLVPTRRWLRFSIRTLLVAVTIFCVWLGWQVSIVRERKAVRKLIDEAGGYHGNPFSGIEAKELIPKVSWFRQRLGDEGVREWTLPKKLEAERARVVRAFPESEIFVEDLLQPYG